MYIVGKISDKGTATEITNQCGCIYSSQPPSTAIILHNIVDLYGGSVSDYTLYDIDDDSNDATRIFHEGALYDLVWTGDGITGVDFSEYDSWKWLDITCDKTEIVGDGVDTATLTLTVYETDKVTVDTTYNQTIDLAVKESLPSSTENYTTQVIFVSGVSTIIFVRLNAGVWVFPGIHDVVNKLRIDRKSVV